MTFRDRLVATGGERDDNRILGHVSAMQRDQRSEPAYMNHAVLITAHRSPALLAELIDAMATSRTQVFAHIDRDAPFSPDRVLRIVQSRDRITMLDPPSSVHWRGFSYLSVVLRLLRAAHANGPFDLYHLLTGQCYPTRKPEEILDTFEAHADRDHLECFELPSDRWTGGGLDRMRYFHLYDRFDARKRVLDIPFNQGIIYSLVRAQRMLGVRRRLPGDFERYYGGSVFWSLTNAAVGYVLRYLDECPEIERGFENTYCPEEILFQTILANSPLADRISGSGLRYIDWTYRNGSIPANLDESDLERIVASDALFARKIDPEHSAQLLAQLRRRTGIGKPSSPP